MTIYELFIQAKSNKIIEALEQINGFYDFIDWDNRLSEEEKDSAKEYLRQLYKEEIIKIKEGKYIPVRKPEYVVIVAKQMSGDGMYYDIARLCKEDVEFAKNIDITNPYEFKDPMIDVLFSTREEILGMDISRYSVERYDFNQVAAGILRHMCFFGIDNEQSEKGKEEAENKLFKAAEQAFSIKEEDYISADDVFKILGYKDDRTPEEKQTDFLYQCALHVHTIFALLLQQNHNA